MVSQIDIKIRSTCEKIWSRMRSGFQRSLANSAAAGRLVKDFPQHCYINDAYDIRATTSSRHPIALRHFQPWRGAAPSCMCSVCCLCRRRDGCSSLTAALALKPYRGWCRQCRRRDYAHCARKTCKGRACVGVHCVCKGKCACSGQQDCPATKKRRR